jgi:hypothetical protein
MPDRQSLPFSQDFTSNSIATRQLLQETHALFYFLDSIAIKDDYAIHRYTKYSIPFFLSCGGAAYAAEMTRHVASIVADTSDKDSLRLFFNSVGNPSGDRAMPLSLSPSHPLSHSSFYPLSLTLSSSNPLCIFLIFLLCIRPEGRQCPLGFADGAPRRTSQSSNRSRSQRDYGVSTVRIFDLPRD